MKNNRSPVFWRIPLWACLGNSQGYISGYASYSFGVSRKWERCETEVKPFEKKLDHHDYKQERENFIYSFFN